MEPDFERLEKIAQGEVRRTMSSLPKRLRQAASQLPVTFQSRPDPALVEDGLEPDTLGLFVGDALPDPSADYAPLPPQILLFLENLWDFAEADEEIFREEIRRTLVHELGHYLGLDETDLEARDLD